MKKLLILLGLVITTTLSFGQSIYNAPLDSAATPYPGNLPRFVPLSWKDAQGFYHITHVPLSYIANLGGGIGSIFTQTVADGRYPLIQRFLDSLSSVRTAIGGVASSASSVPWSGVLSKPTTIAGYGITDAYTKSQIATVGTTGDYNSLINKPNLSPYSINNIQTEYKPFTGSQIFTLANAPTKVILVHMSQTGAPMNNPAITQYSVSGANVTITQPTLQSGDTLEFVYDISTFVNTLPTGAYTFTGNTSQVTLGNGTYTSIAGLGGLTASNTAGQYETSFKTWGSLITDSMKVGASYTPAPGTVAVGNTATQALQKLDGNIAANTTSINNILSYYNGSVIKPTSLPIGSSSALGAYKVGSGLSVDGTGVLSATGAGANASGSYIVQTSTNAPSNAQALGSLSTGILKVTGTSGVLSTAVAADFPVLNQNTTGTAAGITGTNVVTNTNLSQMAASTIKGNASVSTANAADLTATQVTAMLNAFGTTTKGLVPAPSTVNGYVLSDNGTWIANGSGSLPSQTGNAGKFLTTDGTNPSWGGLGAPGIVKYYLNGFGVFAQLNTDSLVEGSTNLFWTNARTLASTLTSYASTTGSITSADNVLTAIEKLDGTRMTNPMSNLGDLIYGGSAGSSVALAGNTGATKKFLVQTGTGTVSTAPSWGGIVAGDIPDMSSIYVTTAGAQTITGVKTYSSTSSSASGTDYGTKYLLTQSQSGTAGFTGIYESVYAGTVGSGTKYLMDIGTDNATFTAHISRLNLDSTGNMNLQGAITSNGIVTQNLGGAFTAYGDLIIPNGSNISNTNNASYLFAGASNIHYRVAFGGGPANLNAGYSYVGNILPTLNEGIAASGTHALLAREVINPINFNGSGATVTNTASLYINGVTNSGTVTGKAYTGWFVGGVFAATGGLELGRTAINDAAYTLLKTDRIVAYTALTATRAVTLPSAASVRNQWFTIMDEAGTAGTDNITVVGTINGVSNPTIINANNGSYTFYSNGTSFFHPTSY